MIHLKKFFENSEEDIQYEEVYCIFDEFLEEMEDDKSEYIGKSDKKIEVTLYVDTLESTASNLEGFGSTLDLYQSRVNYLKRIRVALDRLTYLKYQWSIEVGDEAITISIIRDEVEFGLRDGFGRGCRYIDRPILAKYLLDRYNLTLNSASRTEGTPGYNGSRSSIVLQVNGDFPLDKFREDPSGNFLDIIKDLKSLKENSDPNSYRAFYKVEIQRLNDKSAAIRIEL